MSLAYLGSARAEPPIRPLGAIPAIDLRAYQSEACEAVEAVHSRSRGALVVLPTGAGKTVVAHDPSGDQDTVVRKLWKELVRIDVTPVLLSVSTHAIGVEVECRIDHVQRVSEDEPHWRLRCA